MYRTNKKILSKFRPIILVLLKILFDKQPNIAIFIVQIIFRIFEWFKMCEMFVEISICTECNVK